jgi:hypothetical protein
MVTGASRLSPKLLKELGRVDDGTVPIAEVCRRIGSLAEQYGLTRPSYERVRVLVHIAREERRSVGVSDLRLLLEGGFALRTLSDTLNQVRRSPEDRRPLK